MLLVPEVERPASTTVTLIVYKSSSGHIHHRISLIINHAVEGAPILAWFKVLIMLVGEITIELSVSFPRGTTRTLGS